MGECRGSAGEAGQEMGTSKGAFPVTCRSRMEGGWLPAGGRFAAYRFLTNLARVRAASQSLYVYLNLHIQLRVVQYIVYYTIYTICIDICISQVPTYSYLSSMRCFTSVCFLTQYVWGVSVYLPDLQDFTFSIVDSRLSASRTSR